MTPAQREALEFLAHGDDGTVALGAGGRAAIAAALADLDACRGLLRELEWVDKVCPVCGLFRFDHPVHADDCRLAAVLAAAGEEERP